MHKQNDPPGPCLYLHHFEVFLARPAFGACPIHGNLLPWRMGRNAMLGRAFGFIVNPAANQTYPRPGIAHSLMPASVNIMSIGARQAWNSCTGSRHGSCNFSGTGSYNERALYRCVRICQTTRRGIWHAWGAKKQQAMCAHSPQRRAAPELQLHPCHAKTRCP